MTDNQNHKFNSNDKSILYNHILSPFFDRMVEYIPKWVAPNLITAIGGISIILNIILVILTDYEFQGNRILSFISGILLFLYSAADNMDGKQARRIGASSKLGQIMDHGVDSLVATLLSIPIGSAFNLGHYDTFLFTSACCINFYLVTLQEFYTREFTLWYINGPAEGLYFLISTYLFVSLFSKKPLQFFFKRNIKISLSNNIISRILVKVYNNTFRNLKSIYVGKGPNEINIEFSLFFMIFFLSTILLPIIYCFMILIYKEHGNSITIIFQSLSSWLFPLSIFLLSNNYPASVKNYYIIVLCVCVTFTNQIVSIIYSHVLRRNQTNILISTIVFVLFGFFSKVYVSDRISISVSVFLSCLFFYGIFNVFKDLTNNFSIPIFSIKMKST